MIDSFKERKTNIRKFYLKSKIFLLFSGIEADACRRPLCAVPANSAKNQAQKYPVFHLQKQQTKDSCRGLPRARNLRGQGLITHP